MKESKDYVVRMINGDELFISREQYNFIFREQKQIISFVSGDIYINLNHVIYAKKIDKETP